MERLHTLIPPASVLTWPSEHFIVGLTFPRRWPSCLADEAELQDVRLHLRAEPGEISRLPAAASYSRPCRTSASTCAQSHPPVPHFFLPPPRASFDCARRQPDLCSAVFPQSSMQLDLRVENGRRGGGAAQGNAPVIASSSREAVKGAGG